MAQQVMYPPKVNSPTTALTNTIDSSETSFEVVDGSILPDAPNICTIGRQDNAETILYGQKSGNILSDVTRAFQGTTQSWSAETEIARLFTAYDLESIQQNHMSHLVDYPNHGNLKNRLINGNFDIWQRGGFFWNASQFTADRWRMAMGSTSSVTRSTLTPNNDSMYSIKVEKNSGVNVIETFIEAIDSKSLAGKKVTLSFYVYRNENIGHEHIDFRYADSEDDFSSTTRIESIPFSTLDKEWKKVVITIDLPQDAKNGINIRFLFGVTANAFITDYYISQVQLEEGEYATPFEQRPLGLELILCQRYYTKGLIQASFEIQNAGDFFTPVMQFQTPMRIPPYITIDLQNVEKQNLDIAGIIVDHIFFYLRLIPLNLGIGLYRAPYRADAEL